MKYTVLSNIHEETVMANWQNDINGDLSFVNIDSFLHVFLSDSGKEKQER